jgi:hypothetical protein
LIRQRRFVGFGFVFGAFSQVFSIRQETYVLISLLTYTSQSWPNPFGQLNASIIIAISFTKLIFNLSNSDL